MAAQCAGVGQLQRLRFALQVVFVKCAGLGIHAVLNESRSIREYAERIGRGINSLCVFIGWGMAVSNCIGYQFGTRSPKMKKDLDTFASKSLNLWWVVRDSNSRPKD